MSDQKKPQITYTDIAAYLQGISVKNLYSNIPERFDLISEMFNAYIDWQQSHPDTNVWTYTPCISPELISLTPIAAEDDRVTWQRYQVEFPSADAFDMSAPFVNFENVPARLLGFDENGQKVCPTLADVCAKCEMADVVGVLARIAFQILFGCHPCKGRDYHAPIVMTPEDAYEFFSSDPQMIFDNIQDNTNRFINSYHDKEWLLWNRLNAEQKEFWTLAFGGGYINAEELRDAFVAAYTYLISHVVAPCGQPFTTLVFGEKKSIMIVSDNAISLSQIHCRECFNHMINKCRDCQFPERIAKFQNTVVKLERREVVPRDDGVEEIHSLSKKFVIHDGMIIKGTDFPDLKATEDYFLVVASTKKVNLVGLRNLRDVPIVMTQNGATRSFGKGAIIPLLPGIIIPIEDHYHVVLAGDPPVGDKPEDKQPVQPTPTDPKPTPTDPPKPPQPPVPPTPPTQPKPTVEPPKPPVPPIPPVEPPKPIEPPKPQIKIYDNQVILENGEIWDVSMIDLVEKNDCILYYVTNHATGKKAQLKIFKKTLTDEQKDIIRQNAKRKLSTNVFQLPIGLIQDKGFGAGKTGYVMPMLPDASKQSWVSLASFVKDKRFVMDFGKAKRSEADIARIAAFNIVNAIASLHAEGICYKFWCINNIFIDKETGQVLITCPDYMSEVEVYVKRLHSRYNCPEVSLGICRYDKISDCYNMAIVLFILLTSVHPFDGRAISNGADGSEASVLYKDNPVFIFHPDPQMKNYYFEQNVKEKDRKKIREKYESLEPDIRDLFESTFTLGMVHHVMDIPEIDRRQALLQMTRNRVDRPTINNWIYVIRRWANM